MTLQTYKSSGAVQRAQEFYGKYSEVDERCLVIRERVAAKKEPRRLVLNNNLTYFNDSTIELQEYPECLEGVIASFQDRYGSDYALLDSVFQEWNTYQQHLRVST